ncbi:MAG: cytochrome c3 family protein [Acidobacteriota bacterium]
MPILIKSVKSKNPITSFFQITSGIIFIFLIIFFLTAARVPIQETTVETCSVCHEEAGLKFASNPHSSIENCSLCHTGEKTHLEEGGGSNIFAFKAEDMPNQKTEICLQCHSKEAGRYQSSPHGKSSYDCLTCHQIHQENSFPSLLKSEKTKTCSSCHGEILSLFQLNEKHRLLEGILSCSSCHDPHDPSTQTIMTGFKHESCLKCHRDKGGPYLYEHGASRIEGCTSCHEVHGSPNQHLLITQSVADLCFSCHGAAPVWHSRFDSYSTNCTVCHTAIHGSNLSKIFLK